MKEQNEKVEEIKKEQWETPEMIDVRSIKETYSSGGAVIDTLTLTQAS